EETMSRHFNKRNTAGRKKLSLRGRGERARRMKFEPLEARHLLAVDFLQGYAYFDTNANHQFDSSELPKVNTTIELRQASDNSLVASTLTSSGGYYRFDGVAPGNYKLFELPPVGYTSSFGEITGVFNTGAWNVDHIDVTVPSATSSSVIRVAGIA